MNGKYPTIFHRLSQLQLEVSAEHNSVLHNTQVFLKDKQVLADVALGLFNTVTGIAAASSFISVAHSQNNEVEERED